MSLTKTVDKVTLVSPMTPVDVGGIGGSINLISRNEKTQVKALRDHYEKYMILTIIISINCLN